MTEPNPAPGGEAPPAPVAEQKPAPAPQPAAPPAPGAEPAWLADRLDRERRAVLKALGVEKVDDAKAALDAYKQAQDAAKTEAEKTAERIAALTRASARADELEEIAKSRVAYELGRLTPEQQAAVSAIAGTDAAAQLKAITALTPTWAASAPPAAAPPAAAPPPATSAPPPVAPPPAGQQVSGVDHKAEYQRLKATNPIAAGAYLNAHSREIYPPS